MNMKKLSALCALVLIVALLTLTAAAATITAETKEIQSGTETVTVDVTLTENPGIAGAFLTISYDSALTLTGVAKGTALSTLEFTPGGDLTANPINLMWDGLEADNTTGVIATLTFTAPAGAGEYAVNLSAASDAFYDNDLNDVSVVLTSGSVKVVTETSTHIPGDINDDGKLNMKDVLTLRQSLAGGYSVTIDDSVADLNHDNKVNMKDLLLLRQYLAGGYDVVLN